MRAGYRNQGDFGKAVGASRTAVNTWEGSRGGGPDPERLPTLARAVHVDIDTLFPRHGDPDLADLRCDAGFAQYEIDKQLGAKGAVGEAERGVRRLSPALVSALAAAYGVGEDELRAAEERSFGNLPATLAEKIEYLLARMYPGDQQPPEDADIARGVNEAVGRVVITPGEVTELREGSMTEVDVPPVVLSGLAEALGVDGTYFQPAAAQSTVMTLVEAARTLNLMRGGHITGIAARGMGPDGLPPKLLHLVNDFVEQLQDVELTGWDQDRGSATS
ncbi:helix-turn-helix domain-containing protein [Streptomyces sp. NPDC053474]|uniref:helix-turn-helix domain-containing protein n=1 Tax=Streptomyces sp. NPDC053474 TaxID=3365704 RepID=UPI0037D24B6E